LPATDDERIGQAGQLRTQPHDHDELAQIVDEQPEEAVDIVRHEPSFQEWARSDRSVGRHKNSVLLRGYCRRCRERARSFLRACPFALASLNLTAMALSKQDKAFYEEKLGWKSFGFLLGVTALLGAIIFPVMTYLQDLSAGNTSKWSGNIIFNLSVMGVLLGSVVAVVMYLVFKFFLQMEWLPSRR
jgi:hypothetical protein